MLNYVDLKLRQTLQQEKIEKEKREEIMMDMQNQEEKMSDIQLTKLLLDIPQPYISAQSWAVYDTKTESVLFGRLERERREIASLTKIMTTCVVLNLLKKFNLDERKEMVDISVNASETQGTTAELSPGDRLNVWDLLHGVMLPSGNDAAVALAEHFGYKLLCHREYEQK